MLVTGCGPQEIEKYCLLLPYCNIVLDKVLEMFFIIYHRETLFALARLQYCSRQSIGNIFIIYHREILFAHAWLRYCFRQSL